MNCYFYLYQQATCINTDVEIRCRHHTITLPSNNMLRTVILFTFILGLVALTSGDRVTGNVILNGDSAGSTSLPANSILEIQVLDTRVADASARELAGAVTTVTGPFPIAYQITYTPDIPPLPYYTLSAAIRNGGRLLYRNTYSITTKVQEGGTDVVDIPVDPIS